MEKGVTKKNNIPPHSWLRFQDWTRKNMYGHNNELNWKIQ